MEKIFIKATEEYCSLKKQVPAPYLRKKFHIDSIPERATISICGLGFYLLYINGRNVTKGFLAPYVSNPDDYCYYDTYDVVPFLNLGENVIGIILGNGFMNSLGGYVWNIDKSAWRGAPRVALEFRIATGSEEKLLIRADSGFRVAESPIRFDDLHYGEYFDARKKLANWNLPEFDDHDWKPAIPAKAPRGEFRLCQADPLRVIRTLEPKQIIPCKEGFIYDFGVNSAGKCKLTIKNAKPGQQLILRYAEQVKNNELFVDSVCFPVERFPDYFKNNQKDIYIAKGDPEESWTPHFTYHGFRYVLVEGITEEQATRELLQYQVISSDLPSIGSFSCSDETANKLFAMVQNSDRSNFYYYPTDCPHREKNGWTGDASVSCPHMMLLYNCEASLREWMANIRKSQNDAGALPGIIPTAGWGYDWGNGPAWDSVIFNIPYEVYKLRGNTEIIRENAHMMVRYLQYILTRRSEDGTIAIGLGDWASVGRRFSKFETPLAVTDSILIMDDARKAAELFRVIGYHHEADFAEGIFHDMRETIRRVLLDTETETLRGRTQTAQAMGLYYGVFEKQEEEKAFAVLLDLIHEKHDSFDCGMLGLLTVFHVLSNHGESDLAWHMIVKKEYPSYGHLLEMGETSLPERFMPDGAPLDSHNHHFFGDISRWFIREVAGLKVVDSKTILIQPRALNTVTSAQAYYDLPLGRVSVRWHKTANGGIQLEYSYPNGVDCKVLLPESVPCSVITQEEKMI